MNSSLYHALRSSHVALCILFRFFRIETWMWCSMHIAHTINRAAWLFWFFFCSFWCGLLILLGKNDSSFVASEKRGIRQAQSKFRIHFVSNGLAICTFDRGSIATLATRSVFVYALQCDRGVATDIWRPVKIWAKSGKSGLGIWSC